VIDWVSVTTGGYPVFLREAQDEERHWILVRRLMWRRVLHLEKRVAELERLAALGGRALAAAAQQQQQKSKAPQPGPQACESSAPHHRVGVSELGLNFCLMC
jgi:hypothetical protein